MTDPVAFIHRLSYADLPAAVVTQAKRCVLDLVGVAASGRQTDLSRIVHGFALAQMGGGSGSGARLLFDGRRASASGAAYAGASTIDAFDAHDGHRLTKGHAGVALLPALLAVSDATSRWDGRELLTSLVLGYEIAIRAGIALHASVSDYHTSGAWNALGCAALVARHLGLDAAATRHALGIAEYHGPRSQMMRCIDHPTMVKDGSGWGALAGVSAASLAADGFTGAPAVLVENGDPIWNDLGRRWTILEQYFKLYPVCRWAQPAVEAAAVLMQRGASASRIAQVEIRTFHHAVRLGTRPPASTEEAQYALGFPVAALLVRGRLAADEIMSDGLADSAVVAMAERIRVVEDEAFSARFPAERIAVVRITLDDGTLLESQPTAARGDPEAPLADEELVQKFRTLTRMLPRARRAAIERAVADLDRSPSAAAALAEAVLSPIEDLSPAGEQQS
jgi:2-methylcitrate dehydratase PrpD